MLSKIMKKINILKKIKHPEGKKVPLLAHGRSSVPYLATAELSFGSKRVVLVLILLLYYFLLLFLILLFPLLLLQPR